MTPKRPPGPTGNRQIVFSLAEPWRLWYLVDWFWRLDPCIALIALCWVQLSGSDYLCPWTTARLGSAKKLRLNRCMRS